MVLNLNLTLVFAARPLKYWFFRKPGKTEKRDFFFEILFLTGLSDKEREEGSRKLIFEVCEQWRRTLET